MVSYAVMGKNGFIGSNLCVDLGAVEHGNVFINANGNSKKMLPESNPLKDFDLTVRNTLESIVNSSFDVYVYISSCEVYSGHTQEDGLIDITKVSRYGLSKYLAECVVRNYCKKWLILRLNGPVGPNLKKGPLYDITKGDRLWMSPDSLFQLIHTRTISRFISLVLDKGITNEVFNLTGSTQISLRQVMAMLGREVPGPETPMVEHNISIDKATSVMSIPTSINCINEFRSHYEAEVEFGLRH